MENHIMGIFICNTMQVGSCWSGTSKWLRNYYCMKNISDIQTCQSLQLLGVDYTVDSGHKVSREDGHKVGREDGHKVGREDGHGRMM
jgi:5'(3')-deoxyribonucleotidase